MSQTLTETSIVPLTTVSRTSTDQNGQESQDGIPQDEVDIENETNNSTAEDESQYPTGRKFQIILLSISLVLIASDVGKSLN